MIQVYVAHVNRFSPSDPLITVIFQTYNSSLNFLQAFLHFLLGQKYQPDKQHVTQSLDGQK